MDETLPYRNNVPRVKTTQESLVDAILNRASSDSMLSIKQQKVEDKFRQKQQKLRPDARQILPEIEREIYSNSSGSRSGLVDVAQSSVLQAGGNIADAGKGLTNYLLGTSFDDSADTGYSNMGIADETAGVSQDVRQAGMQSQEQVLTDIAGRNYWDAALSALKASPYTLADSAATPIEVAAGAALSGLGGAGIGLLGKKVADTYDTVRKIQKAYEKVSDNMIVKAAKTTGKEISKSSLLTADMVQRQRADYIAENGEEPSAARLASSVVIILATTAWTPKMIEKLYLPKLMSKSKKSDSDLRTQFQEAFKGYMARAEKGTLPKIADRIARGVTSVAAAGGAEAVQEYAQFWGETLVSQVKPDEQNSLFQEVFAAIENEENIDRSLQSLFLGGAAGGATKGMIASPSLAAGTIADTAYGASRAVKNNIQKRVQESLNTEDSQKLDAEYALKKKASDELVAENTTRFETLGKAKKFSDLEAADLQERVQRKAGDKDLKDEKVFTKARDAAMRELLAESTASSIAASKTVDTGKRTAVATGKAAKSAAKALNITPETIGKVVTKVKTASSATAEKVKKEYENFPQSTTLAVIEGASLYGVDKSKKSLNYLKESVKNVKPKVSKAIADAFRDESPEIAEAIDKEVAKQENAAEQAGVTSSSTYNTGTLPQSVKMLSQGTEAPANVVSNILVDFAEVAKGSFETAQTAEFFIAAIDSFENSESTKNLPEQQRQQLESFKEKAEQQLINLRDTETDTETDTSVDSESTTAANSETGTIAEALVKGWKKVKKAASEVKNSDEVKNMVDYVTSSDVIKSAQKAIDSKDPTAVYEYLKKNVISDDEIKDLKKTVESAVSNLNNTAAKSKEAVANVVKVFSNLSEEEKKKLPKENLAEDSERENSGKVKVVQTDEDTYQFYDVPVSDEDVDSFIDEFIGKDNICKD